MISSSSMRSDRPSASAHQTPRWTRFGSTIVEYLLGFFALAAFAAYAFARGAPDDERWLSAFKLGACLAVLELLILAGRRRLANRLVVAANLWLIGGGVAAFTQQWWFLQGYQRLGEASLFGVMLLVGVVSTVALPGGFVAAVGPRNKVFACSVALLMAVCAALAVAIIYRGNIKVAGVLPVIALSWLNRILQRLVSGAR